MTNGKQQHDLMKDAAKDAFKEIFQEGQRDLMKSSAKEAFKEFLYERWIDFSGSFTKWVLGLFAAALIAALFWLILTAHGWKAPSP